MKTKIRHGRTSVIERTALQLTEQAAFLNSILKSSTEYSIIATDLDGTIRSWNEGARRVYGYDAQEVVGKAKAFILHDPEDVKSGRAQAILDKAQRTGKWEGPLTQVRKKGARFTAHVTITLRWDTADRPIGFTMISRDFTESERIERALRESQEYNRGMIEALVDALLTVDPELRIVDVNEQTARMTGYSRKELIGSPFSDYFTDPQRAEDGIRKVLAEDRVTNYELTIRAKDGKETVVSCNATTFKGADGRLRGVFAAARDITEQKRFEEQFRQAQKMEAVGQLAGGIAHDFNNLLTVINGYCQILLTAADPGDPRREGLEQIKVAGERAANLTRQLLAFSRRQILQLRVVDLNAIVTNLDKMLQRVLSNDIELKAELSPNLGGVKADPGQIEQVIMNLAVNARDAMPQGGKLTIATANVELDESYTQRHITMTPGRYVLLAVNDTGCGMDKDTQKRIFEPFFTTKEADKGTGLGLSTVYGIVKQSGGYVWVSSKPGQGAKFKIYLPRVDERVETVEPVRLPVEMLRRTETVLLVEDNAGVRALARDVLKSRGYTVLEASNGAEGLRIAEQHNDTIHLLVSAVVMPGMSGRQLEGRLTAIHPDMKVLYMAGYADNAIARHGIWEPGLALLRKPFMPDALLHKVREVLDAPEQEAT